MNPSVGIGIVTFNRREILRETVEAVRRFTQRDDAVMVVADDGSSDGTVTMLRELEVPVVSGINMGVAWNKNRALFLLAHLLRCETVILLEDDTGPTARGWELAWMEAAERWGHMNFFSPWMEPHRLSGGGTVEDPILSAMVTAQCSAYSNEALTWGGYFDPTFRGFGHEHIEYSRRLVRIGYGGTDRRVNGQEEVRFFMIRANLAVAEARSNSNPADEERNLQLAQVLMGREEYRAPWRNKLELRQFRSEVESAMDGTGAGANGFMVRPPIRPANADRPRLQSRLAGLLRRG